MPKGWSDEAESADPRIRSLQNRPRITTTARRSAFSGSAAGADHAPALFRRQCRQGAVVSEEMTCRSGASSDADWEWRQQLAICSQRAGQSDSSFTTDAGEAGRMKQ